MNKDYDLKKDPGYGYDSRSLRGRINQAIKQVRDDAEELDVPQGKVMPVIPVTGTGASRHKYFNNKSRKAY